MKTGTIIFSLLVFIMLFACNQRPEPKTEPTAVRNEDSAAACSKETIMDPNGAKPMALMMRQMAANADSIRSTIMRGQKPDTLRFPFIRFHLVEPTDPDVLQPQFFENARVFQLAWNDLFRNDGNSAKYYNAMIGKCVNCHESYCSGPLKRIRKLYIK